MVSCFNKKNNKNIFVLAVFFLIICFQVIVFDKRICFYLIKKQFSMYVCGIFIQTNKKKTFCDFYMRNNEEKIYVDKKGFGKERDHCVDGGERQD